MFVKKQIAQPTRTGDRLRALREQAGLTIDELATITKLQKNCITALETNAFEHIATETVYKKMYIKRYATALGADPAPLLTAFTEEELNPLKAGTPVHVAPAKQSTWLRQRPAMISLTSGIAVFAFFIFYLGGHLSNLYEPPTLELTTPTEGEINETGVTTIAGLTDPEVSVFINGEQVRSGQDGSFATDVDLQPGVNTILVSARKRHGTESNVTKYVMYRETSQVSLSESPQLTTN